MFDIKEIAAHIGIGYEGPVLQLIGMNTLKDASGNELSFVSNTKYVKDLEETQAGVVIVPPGSLKDVPSTTIALVSEEPYLAMAKVSKLFAKPFEEKEAPDPVIGQDSIVSARANVENGAVIGNNCRIMAGAYIGTNVKIGNNVIIHPNVTIYRDCEIGDECMIHAGTVIGSDGFGFATTKTGTHVKIYQNGNAVLERDVEIGSNCTIDCAAFGTTLIKEGVRIDNLVQVGHNCVIGEYSVVVSQAGVAGSTVLGRNVVMGAQSGMAGHLEVAPFTTLAARSGVTKSIKEPGGTYAGFPLMGHREWLKLQGKMARLLKS